MSYARWGKAEEAVGAGGYRGPNPVSAPLCREQGLLKWNAAHGAISAARPVSDRRLPSKTMRGERKKQT